MSETGKKLIDALNKEFKCKIENNKENQSNIESLVSNIYCDDCDERRDCDNCDERMGEPMTNEGYL